MCKQQFVAEQMGNYGFNGDEIFMPDTDVVTVQTHCSHLSDSHELVAVGIISKLLEYSQEEQTQLLTTLCCPISKDDFPLANRST